MDHGQRVLGGGTGQQQQQPQQQRPPPPQRALSGSHAIQQGLKRPAVPSRLNNVRSVSQPGNYVDLTSDGVSGANTAAFMHNGRTIESSSSPNTVIDLSDDDDEDDSNEPPAKRAKTTSHVPAGSAWDCAQDAAHQRVPGSPLPPPPMPRLPVTVGRGRRPVIDRLARKANGLEPPACATRLPPPRQVADFGPWSGQHPEDVITEGVVKNGYYDKPPGPNSTECSSAKPTIWPNLSAKNNMGLQTLSYLFASVMEKRQALGKCTAPSTFKPPPRVTVTDTKREAWLRDLANPDVPLRKQSRTIPHGIRGKLLMEQCLTKNIMMPRAVWLAKCVGANELRAFRRRGVSGPAAATGESMWVREWTVQVEQFLDSVIAMCGQPEWQSKMDYAVKLSTAFYAERLVERDHYLDWVVSSYAQAAVDKLPVWIVLVQLYWKDIMAFGRRGRQLAQATLENLDQLTRLDSRAHDTLETRLQKLIMIMAAMSRGCLIIPRTWQKYQHLLSPKSSTHGTPAHNIMRRNVRLLVPLNKTSQNTRCPLLRLYGLLDAHTLHIDVEKLANACQTIVPDTSKLVAALLEWSASAFRTGSSRAYLAARVIASLHSKSVDTDAHVLQYLQGRHSPAVAAADVHRVIAELARDNCFSCGRYMQWLITSGVMSGCSTSELATGLLTALPSNALPSHLQNTRKSLLRRIPGVEDESTVITATLQAIATLGDSLPDINLVARVKILSATARYDLATATVAHVGQLVKEDALRVDVFSLARDVLEASQDTRALGMMLQEAMAVHDTEVLASISDTITMHAKSFAAVGSLPFMLRQIIEHYRILRSHQALDRTLIIALMTLTRPFADKALFQHQQQVLAALPSDLALSEQQSSLSVCSPASDSLISMQAGSLDSDQEIDAVFASGNTMDEQLMQRVFARIVQRVGKAYGNADGTAKQTSPKLCAWLTQLRAVDATNFDSLVKDYAQACLRSSGDTAAPLNVVSALIASGCIGLDSIVNLAQSMRTPTSACTALRLLTSEGSGPNMGLRESEAYRLRVAQQRVRHSSADSVISLLVMAMEDPRLPVDDLALIPLLLDYSVSRYQSCLRAVASAPASPVFLANCSRLITKILSFASGSADPNIKLDAKTVIGIAHPISIVQCTTALSFIAKVDALKGARADDALQIEILEAITSGSEVWPQLLESGGQDSIRSIYQWARDQVLSCASPQDPTSTMDEAQASRNLDILFVAHHAIKDGSDTQVIPSLTEKLKGLCDRLPKSPSGTTSKQDLLALKILLHLSILYTSDAVPEGDNPRSGRDNLLAILCIVLGHPGLQCHQDVLEYMHDVASTLADTLPAECLAALGQAMARNGVRDPRLAFILGNTSNPDAWLALVSYPQAQTGGGGSAQAKALLQRAAQQQQQAQAAGRPVPVPGVGGPAVLQRAMSMRAGQQPQSEAKIVPYALRRWEIMSDATPSMGDNDTSLSLGLFGARKVS